MSDSDSLQSTPPNLKHLAENATSEMLPEKSKARHEAQYNLFKTWCDAKGAKLYTENVLLAYFMELVSNNKKSLWSIYSMLKSCIIIYDNKDISKYAKLISYIKRKTSNYTPKKSQVLEEENIHKFIEQASDEEFLLMKVILIIGVSGACRREELYKMVIKDIEIKDDIILIQIPVTKTNTSRSFVISKREWVKLVQKYLEIRMVNTAIKDRLFLKYQKGKCVNLPVGINTIGSVPTRIATFLNLENPTEFTGHCFRRSSATMLVNRGGDLLALKRFGGWKLSTVAEGYIEESLKRKIDVAQMMTDAGPSNRKQPTVETPNNEQGGPSRFEVEIESTNTNLTSNLEANQFIPGLFTNTQNCKINVNIYNNCTFEKKM